MKKIKFKSTIDVNFDDLQARLNAITGSSENFLHENIWLFIDKRGSEFIIDFNEFLDLECRHPEWESSFGTSLIYACKFAWILSVEKSTVEQFRSKFFGLGLLLEALDHLGIHQVTADNLPNVLDFVLMHGWFNGRPQRRATPHSAPSFWRLWCPQEWRTAFSAVGIDIVSAGLHFKTIKEQVKQAIPRLTAGELSYADWLDGGTFNQLTLDYGQYFIEHCLHFFDEHIALGQAVASTLRTADEIASQCEIHIDTAGRLIRRFLIGHSAKDILAGSDRQLSSADKISLAYKLTVDHFKTTYSAKLFSAAMLKDELLIQLLTKIGLQSTPDNIDRFRMIVWLWLDDDNREQTEELLSTSVRPIRMSNFLRAINALRVQYTSRSITMPSVESYLALGLDETRPGHETLLPRAFTTLLEKFGLVSFLALTGWRRSEYGFSMYSVDVSRNKDLLDQNAFPYRYSVIWRVPKTGDEIREKREITFGAFLYVAQMWKLVGTELEEKPCLYSVISTKQDIFDSSNAVYSSLREPWKHFVLHYAPFQEIDRLTKKNRAAKELHRNYHPTLIEAWRRSRTELSTIEFYFTPGSSPDKRNWLSQYVDRTLRPDWLSLIDERLTPEIKDWISSLAEDQLRSGVNSRYISSEIVSECLYPTPHAIRHLWCEAVLRRYDGDVGWMIRSQFKHVSASMWLRYTRDKDNWSAVKHSEMRVVSSLVYNRLLAGDKNYAGQMNKYIRRIELMTDVRTPEELRELTDYIAAEIVGIATLPWGYCLTKGRTLSAARCAEFGIPARHNASPELCLSCPHNLIQSSNIDWLLFHISPHVEMLGAPPVPQALKSKSAELVGKVIRHVRAIDPNHEALAELDEALNDFMEPEAIKWC